MKYYDKLIFEVSREGRTGYSLPETTILLMQRFPPPSRGEVHFFFRR